MKKQEQSYKFGPITFLFRKSVDCIYQLELVVSHEQIDKRIRYKFPIPRPRTPYEILNVGEYLDQEEDKIIDLVLNKLRRQIIEEIERYEKL